MGERVGIDQATKRFAINVLHGDKINSLGLPHFVDGSDVRMVDRSGASSFSQQSLMLRLVYQITRADNFKCHQSSELLVLGLVHHAHPPLAQSFQNVKMPKALPNQSLRSGRDLHEGMRVNARREG